MTIAQAFNDITLAQGGTPNAGGTIAGAIDALNDTLAGSDQPSASTIEGAIRLLGEHIGGGVAPSGTIEITENGEGIDVAQYAYADVNVAGGSSDLSTAMVAITAADVLSLQLPVCVDELEWNYVGADSSGSLNIGENTFKVLLYKGKAFISTIINPYTFSDLSGSIEYDSDNFSYVITGDCSFSVAEGNGGGFPGL